MKKIADLEKLYRNKMYLDYFSDCKKEYFTKFKVFDKNFLNEFYNLIAYFKQCVFYYGNCDTAKSVYEIYDITNSFLYTKLLYYIQKYCIKNGISFNLKDKCVFVGGRAIANDASFFYDIYGLDILISSLDASSKLDDVSSKLDFIRASRKKLNKNILGTNNVDKILDLCVDNSVFDDEFLVDYYLNKSNDLCECIELKKIPSSLISYEFINKGCCDISNDVNSIITSIIKEYSNRYNLRFVYDDYAILLNGKIIGNKDGYFFTVFNLDEILRNQAKKRLTNKKKKYRK